MTTGLSIALVIVGLAISIFVGTKFKVNGGLVAMFFAWLVGCVCNGLSASKLIGYWPTSVMFIIISTGLFFGVARNNGTLTVLTQKLLYKARNAAALIPIVVFGINFIIGAAGAGSIAPQLFMSSLIYGMADQLGINVLMLMVASWAGATAGGGMFWSAEGANRIAYYGQVGGPVTPDVVSVTVTYYSIILFVALLICTLLWYFILGGFKAKGSKLNLQEPPEFTDVQKKTLAIVGVVVVVIIVPAVLKMVSPSNFTKALASCCDIQLVCIIGFLVEVFMGLCEEKKIVESIPVNLILTIAGYCMLIKVAIDFDLPEIFSNILLEAGLPSWILPSMFLLFACLISLFSNFAVIYPLLFPLIPVVAAATGLNSIALFGGACLGSCLTGFSPFSTGGACQLSACRDDELARKLTPKMLGMAFANAALMMIIIALGILNVFPDPLAGLI